MAGIQVQQCIVCLQHVPAGLTAKRQSAWPDDVGLLTAARDGFVHLHHATAMADHLANATRLRQRISRLFGAHSI